jgi:hypothetical protein
MIMRFRPANISLINRRHYLPRLLLTLSSKHENKNHANDSKMLTGSHHINVRVAGCSQKLVLRQFFADT